ncbi:MAG: hypothetical protein NTV58_15075 [Deltaproteobacteria bacterium]|nr:hypothetical protein [Deltaproteobacteria bacterium]
MRDYREIFTSIAGDIRTFTNNHPDNFDILLFKVKDESRETTEIEWEDPVVVSAVKMPGCDLMKIADFEGDPAKNFDRPIVLLIDDPMVPLRSVLDIEETISADHIHVHTFVVTEIYPADNAQSAGKIYTCVPVYAVSENDDMVEDFVFIEPPWNHDPPDKGINAFDSVMLIAGPFIVHGRDVIHAFSHWQVWEMGYSAGSPIFDSGRTLENLTNCHLPEDVLEPGKTYCWHVMYGSTGDNPAKSEYSIPTSFTTLEHIKS